VLDPEGGKTPTSPTAIPSCLPSGLASCTSFLTLDEPVSTEAGERANAELSRAKMDGEEGRASNVAGEVGRGEAGGREGEDGEEEEFHRTPQAPGTGILLDEEPAV
jgi:hypothetical protein